MYILVTADLHLDTWQHAARDPFSSALPALGAVDALIVAGDLANNPIRNWPKALSRLAMLMEPKKIYILPGNHDYYHFHIDGDERLRGMVEAAGMNWAQKTVVQVDNVRFLCATLWTDFRLSGDEAASQTAAARAMNDYELITRTAAGDRLLPQHTATIHVDHLAWLTAEIARPFDGRTVIITHHGPSPSA
ncbi:MAG: metallophosphoesterase, partial [Pseudorhodobacter sp.]|nr:metallophosphoesterase [Pseudorhodobacter sp.]